MGLYGDGTGATTLEVILADPAAAEWITECFEIGDKALRAIAPQADPIPWPEHFDVAITVDGVGDGVSPGDEHSSLPYAYVWIENPPADEFWNAPFGATCAMQDLRDAEPTLSPFHKAESVAGEERHGSRLMKSAV